MWSIVNTNTLFSYRRVQTAAECSWWSLIIWVQLLCIHLLMCISVQGVRMFCFFKEFMTEVPTLSELSVFELVALLGAATFRHLFGIFHYISQLYLKLPHSVVIICSALWTHYWMKTTCVWNLLLTVNIIQNNNKIQPVFKKKSTYSNGWCLSKGNHFYIENKRQHWRFTCMIFKKY